MLHLLYLCIKTRTTSAGPRSLASAPMKEGRLWIESPTGTDPPPCIAADLQKALRGDYHDIRDKWLQFDPQVYHCVEPVSKGERRSIALVTPRSWKRLPARCLDELIEMGSCPPLSAQVAEVSATVLPVAGPCTPLSSLAVLNKADEPPQSPWALPVETVTLTLPNDDDLADLDNWCKSELVALQSASLPTSDGSMMPLNQDELNELTDHVNSGHRDVKFPEQLVHSLVDLLF